MTGMMSHTCQPASQPVVTQEMMCACAAGSAFVGVSVLNYLGVCVCVYVCVSVCVPYMETLISNQAEDLNGSLRPGWDV